MKSNILRTKNGFSAGPWRVTRRDKRGFLSIVAEDGRVVATTGQAWRRGRVVCDVNARLISLSPELLALVQDIVLVPIQDDKEAAAILRRGEALIKKLKDESPGQDSGSI